tara:strand:+ start:69 stop:278 length:210 start_codon:yes stop_codon:yes gene_type:complete
MFEYRKIIIFDDGLQKYKDLVNVWIVILSKFNGGKLVLKNADNKDIVINTISTWKTEIIKQNNIETTKR